jgi:hypothetical protein
MARKILGHASLSWASLPSTRMGNLKILRKMSTARHSRPLRDRSKTRDVVEKILANFRSARLLEFQKLLGIGSKFWTTTAQGFKGRSVPPTCHHSFFGYNTTVRRCREAFQIHSERTIRNPERVISSGVILLLLVSAVRCSEVGRIRLLTRWVSTYDL